MDELSLQEANRFQGEQVVNQESVGVFESPNDTSKDKRYIGNKHMKDLSSRPNDKCEAGSQSLPVGINTCL